MTSARTTWFSVRRLIEAKNSGPERKPMVNTNRPNRIDLSIDGMTKVPSCPRITATIKVQAVAPMANPRMRMRPRIVPMPTARKRKISGRS